MKSVTARDVESEKALLETQIRGCLTRVLACEFQNHLEPGAPHFALVAFAEARGRSGMIGDSQPARSAGFTWRAYPSNEKVPGW